MVEVTKFQKHWYYRTPPGYPGFLIPDDLWNRYIKRRRVFERSHMVQDIKYLTEEIEKYAPKIGHYPQVDGNGLINVKNTKHFIKKTKIRYVVSHR